MIFLRLLPAELALLGINEVEYEFYRKLIENSSILIVYRVIVGRNAQYYAQSLITLMKNGQEALLYHL